MMIALAESLLRCEVVDPEDLAAAGPVGTAGTGDTCTPALALLGSHLAW